MRCYSAIVLLAISRFPSERFFFCDGWIVIGITSRTKQRSSSSLSVTYKGRGSIPYVETYEEQNMREIWEQNPFSTAASIVDTVLTNDLDSADSSPSLQRLDDSNNNHASSLPCSGYDDLFKPLYYYGSYDNDNDNDVMWNNPTEDKLRVQASERLRSFFIRVAYRGGDFCGWQTQPNNNEKPSVQKTLEEWLAVLQEQGDRAVNVRVCGRTDAGVHAIGQVCRFRTHNQALEDADVKNHLQALPSTSNMRITQVVRVTRAFHPTFTANCRAYAYLIDLDGWQGFESRGKLDINILNRMLQVLEGKELDYIGLSYGKLKTQTQVCTLYHARACLVRDNVKNKTALCIELVGNRFLRRMVRNLVGTAMLIALQQETPSTDAFLRHIQEQDRKLIRMVAPPDGLIFVGAQFDAV